MFQNFQEENIFLKNQLVKMQYSKTTLLDSIIVPFGESQFSVVYIKWPPFATSPWQASNLWLTP